jgi:PKD repeat protein
MRTIVLILLMSVLFFSCSKDDKDNNEVEELNPVADFDYRIGEKVTSGVFIDKVPVYFFNNSENAHSYLWEFDDNRDSDSKERNPIMYFPNGGTWIVKLTAYSESKLKSAQQGKTIRFLPK